MPIEFGKLALQTAPGTASPFPMDSKKPLPTGKPPSPKSTGDKNLDYSKEEKNQEDWTITESLKNQDGTLSKDFKKPV